MIKHQIKNLQKIITSVITFLSFCLVIQAQEAAPKIISTIPIFGDCNVSTDLKEIIFRFDQDMQPGMSIPDSKNMPKVAGRPVWIDKRTLSIPVKLDSSRFYILNCNTWRFRNFKNVNGIPLNPDVLCFKTVGDYQSDFNKNTYDEFLRIFPGMYSYAPIKQIDWSELIKQNHLEDSKTNFEFTLKLMNVLKNAEDPHMWIDYVGQAYYPHSRKFYLINYNVDEIFKALEEKKISENKVVLSGKYGDVGYIYIETWDNKNKNEIRTAIDRLKEFKSLKNIIVDVRANSGGDESLASEFASCFIKEPMPYELVKSFNKETAKFETEHIKYIYPDNSGFNYDGNVYVLSGPRVFSSNEAFILMMKQAKNAKVIGMKSYGSTGNPKPYKLSDQITLYLPSWQAYTLDKKLIEGNGVEPDIEIINSQADFIGKDALFNEVIKYISQMSTPGK